MEIWIIFSPKKNQILRTSPECRTTGHLNLSSDGAFKSGMKSNEIRHANKVVHVYLLLQYSVHIYAIRNSNKLFNLYVFQ